MSVCPYHRSPRHRRPSSPGAVAAFAALATVALLVGAASAPVGGQEFDDFPSPRMTVPPGYGAPVRQSPPWHGSVAAAPNAACGPACHHCGGYGPACARMGCQGCGLFSHRALGVSLPPFFPRLHTLFHDGYLPTPPPVALPRCHNCGAHIDGGF
ncbi:MAG: hypothetical protein ACKO9B_18505 [Planctomycetota bacterium]